MERHSNRSLDLICAVAVGVLTLALFVATLQPDVGGPEDTPKFQFLGYVLGTGHPPGYPLYVMLSHVFVQLPIGTIAYRANLFSAVMAALSCALTYVIARQLGAGRVAAVAAATALATGLSFWTNAVFAEVYSLAAVMVAATIVCLLKWGERGGVRWLLAAVAAFSLALGNHLTIVGIAPAAILYVLVRDRRVLTPRVIALAIAIGLLGVSQYGFIMLRTYQGAPFLESRATTVSELRDVILAKRFARQRFAFTPSSLVTTQVPAVASAIRAELGLAGVALLIAGLAAGVARRSGPAWLVIGAALGSIAMILNISGDVGGFITPILPLLWALAACGITTVADLLRGFSRVGVQLAATATALTLLIPAARLQANYAAADRNKDSTDARFMREVFRQLPERAGLVAENYLVVSLLEYFLLTEEAGPNRGIVGLDYSGDAVRRAAADGRRVFALGEAATFMLTEGLRFERAQSVTSPLGAVYELVGEAPCVEVESEWTDISTVFTTGSWATTMASLGSVKIETEIRAPGSSPTIARELLGAGKAEIVRTAAGSTGVEQTFQFTRTHNRRPVFRVAGDAPFPAVRARLEPGGASSSLLLCSHVPPALFRQGSAAAEINANLDSEAYFGPGWSLPERVGDTRVRRGENGATLLLPLVASSGYRLQLEVDAKPEARIDVRVNGQDAGHCDPTSGSPCDVTLAPGLFRDGVNSLSLLAAASPGSGAVVLTFSRARIQRLDAYNGPGR
jgi:transmembrane protein TMEM260 (protein O-mannosyltransferase)